MYPYTTSGLEYKKCGLICLCLFSETYLNLKKILFENIGSEMNLRFDELSNRNMLGVIKNWSTSPETEGYP